MAQARKCSFCGEPPKDRSKEHVVPKWLLRVTDSMRDGFQVEIHRDGESKNIRLGFSSFILPACDECNNKYAELETSAKKVVESILSCEPLTPNQIHTLLDWLDKVRTGVWMWELITVANPMGVEPKFNMGSRIGSKDRLLKVARFDYPEKAISISCTGSLAFHYSPSCFGLIINNVYIASCSFDNLLGPSLGTPCIAEAEVDFEDTRRMRSKVAPGGGQVLQPPWRDRWLLGGTTYMQPVFKYLDSDMREVVFRTDYALEEATDAENGMGAIFVLDSNGLPVRLRRAEHHMWDTRSVGDLKRVQILSAAEITRFQRYLLGSLPVKGIEAVDNRRWAARRESEHSLLDLQNQYVMRYGLPLRICDGVVLSKGGDLISLPHGAISVA